MVSINKSLAINAGTSKTIGKIIVLHSTDTDTAPAVNIATYEHREWANIQTFVHFAVDDKEIYQIGTPGYKAWGAGNVNAYAPVQIELCEWSNDKARSLKAYANYIALARQMADQYGVPKTLDDGNKTAGFKSHLWCSRNYGGSDHSDPYAWLSSIGISKAQFAHDLANGIDGTKISGTTSAHASKPSRSASAGGRVAQNGTVILYGNNVRTAPSTSAKITGTLSGGTKINYDSYIVAEGIVWVSYISNGGGRRYIARKRQSDGYIYAGIPGQDVASSGKPAAHKPSSKPASKPSSRGWISQNGTFTLNTAIKLRTAASTSAGVISTLTAGQSVKYNAFMHSGGYVWIRQSRGNGYGYLATGESNGSKRLNYWGSFK